MNTKLENFAQRYIAALRIHHKPDVSADLLLANKLGRQALSLGFDTLEMARVHEKAILFLKLTITPRIKRMDSFFIEAISPIIETFPASKENQIRIGQLIETLDLRTKELASAHRELKKSSMQRKSGEASLKKCNEHYTLLLNRSLHLQNGLRQLTRQLLGTQEKERKRYSVKLENEIAQTLVGVNVRLLTLKKASKVNTRGVTKQISSTQKMVAKSVHSVRRAATRLTNTGDGLSRPSPAAIRPDC